jgi:hypothetical protein
MKGFCGGENQTKLKQPLPEVQSTLFANQGTHFIFHSSLLQKRPCTGKAFTIICSDIYYASTGQAAIK